MVKELDELQGYMGMVYAKAFGEEEEVAKAIYEHYFPKSATDPCPMVWFLRFSPWRTSWII